MLTLPVPCGYEFDIRFTLFSSLFVTSKGTYDLVSGQYGDLNWGGDWAPEESSQAFRDDLLIRGHTEGDERYVRQRFYLIGIQGENYLQFLYHLLNPGREDCPEDIRRTLDLGIPFSLLNSVEYI